MTMVRQLRWSVAGNPARRAWVARTVAVALWACLGTATAVRGQDPQMHYRHGGLAPPGAIGSVQLQRGGPLPGYFQPVEIRAPRGAQISMAVAGAFDAPQQTPLRIGLLIAPVYRLKVSNLPGREGEQVYPTIELIDRIYPPRGQERRFPVPIELTEEDLQLALDGKYVTRVVYLEEPDRALPVAQRPDQQEWFDAGPGVNPVEEADRWGRPLAIVRMGGRVPDERGPDMNFLGGCPPFTFFRPWQPGEQVGPGVVDFHSATARPQAPVVASRGPAPRRQPSDAATLAERKATEKTTNRTGRWPMLPAVFRRSPPAGGR